MSTCTDNREVVNTRIINQIRNSSRQSITQQLQKAPLHNSAVLTENSANGPTQL